MTSAELFKLSYVERQNIVVVPKDLADEIHEVAPGEGGPLWKRIWPKKSPEALHDQGQLPEYIDRLVKAQLQLRKNGHELRFVADDETVGLDFDAPGHPVRDVVYVGHPMIPSKYYPAALFHRELLEDRYCELFSLLVNLGATHIRVEGHGTANKGFRFAISGFSFGNDHVEASKTKTESTVWEATLAGADPVLPDNLLWYRFEKTWQTIANARLNFGLQTFDVSIDQKEDFGVDASFANVIRGLNFKLGGEYSDLSSVSLRLSGEFAPMQPPAGGDRDLAGSP